MSGLHVDWIGPQDAQQPVLVAHGILGAGRNWRGFTRRLLQVWPGVRVGLVDLPNHGKTGRLLVPDTLAGAADTLSELAEGLDRAPIWVGHSFGGKVVLQALSEGAPAHSAWILDSPPHRQTSGAPEVTGVIAAARSVGIPAEHRGEARAQLQASGLPEALVQWLLTSLIPGVDGYHWAWDLDGIETQLRDHLQTDFMAWLDQPRDIPIHIVRAELSDRWPADHWRALTGLAPDRRVHCTICPNATHWLHVANPAGLLDILAGREF